MAKTRQRRKDARPNEIVAAAFEVFAERGYRAAKFEEIARLAGIAKSTVFVYFPTKQDLFRAVARSVLSINLEHVRAAADMNRPLATLVPELLAQFARVGEGRVPAMMRLLVAEARTFPELARVWHDEVVAPLFGLLVGAIRKAQARGEARDGDPRLYAFSILGPLMASVIFREVFKESGAALPDLRALAGQHATTVLGGLLPDAAPRKAKRSRR